MPRKIKTRVEAIAADESFENLQLKKRIKELEKQLNKPNLKQLHYSG